MADDGRRVHIPEPTCLAGKRNEASPASSRQGQEIRVRDRRHSPAVRVQHTHSKPVQGSVIGTLGNFSASIGKAKSKKTFNVSAIVAAALKNGTVLNYTAELPENKRKILYVDTEQSSYHCAKVARRSLRMAGLPTGSNHENLEFLVLRKYTPEERIAIVREAIYRTENVGLVIIDGIRDMVYDINSPGESTKVISLLMTWTGERNIHIHTILHQNKGDENARGHIGTELSNKELAEALQEAYASVGVTLGDNKVVKLITVLKSKRMIVQENGRKYTFNPDFHY